MGRDIVILIVERAVVLPTKIPLKVSIIFISDRSVNDSDGGKLRHTSELVGASPLRPILAQTHLVEPSVSDAADTVCLFSSTQ